MDAFSLMYHDVVEPSALDASGFASPDAATYKLDVDMFQQHLAAVSAAVARAELDRVSTPRALTWRKPSAPPAVLLHFDDGGACALDVADRLERAGWHGYFHIPTDRLGTPGFVTPHDVCELHDRGHVIGTHSCSHPARMSSLPRDRLVHEWSASRARLEDLLGAPVKVGSVPGGFCSHEVIMAADRAGLEILFTSEPTSRFTWTRGCLVLGRYAVRRTTRPDEAARLAIGAPWPCWRQWASWNAKKVLKRIGGDRWLAAREGLLGWASRARGPRGHAPQEGAAVVELDEIRSRRASGRSGPSTQRA